MKRCAVLMLILISASSYSQNTRHQSASVILQSGDSLNGFIANESLNDVYKTIKFKQSEDQDFKTLSSEEVVRFRLSDGDQYESHLVKYDGESQDISKLTYNRDPLQWTEEKVFVQILAKGPVTLFDFEEPNGRIHFLISKEGIITELLNRVFLVQQDLTNTNKRYIGQLRSAFLDCPTTIVNNDLRYERNALISAVNKYYACMGVKPVAKHKDETKLRFGIALDFFYEKQNYTMPISLYNFSIHDFGVYPGLSIETYSTKPYKKFSFYLEARYKMLKGNDEVPFKLPSIEFLLLPRFNYLLKQKKSLFWNAGISISYVFNTEITDPYPNKVYNYFYGITPAVGLVGGVGFYAIKKEKIDLSLELRAKYGSPYVAYMYKNTFSCIGLIINVFPKFKSKS